MTPEVVNIVRDKLKAPQFKYTSSITGALRGSTKTINEGRRWGWDRLARPRNLQTGDPGGPLRQWVTQAATPSNTNPNPSRLARTIRAVFGWH
ncbi:MAG: hypothetical protein CO136_01800 [Candidatus Levybacteria bacterium CG_4_9_14_3_um_filter_36_7]|nr:MAG: hypothetical protein CO136_01800 [Candidatus Levybacteria bacterium CG_4_9_14_3_um_filter_36_7]